MGTGRFCCGGCTCEESWITWGDTSEISPVAPWGSSGSSDCPLTCGVEVSGGVGWLPEATSSDVLSWGRGSDFPVVLRGTVLRVFLEDTMSRKLLICEDVSSMRSCMSSVSKASFSISSGSWRSCQLFQGIFQGYKFYLWRHFLVHESGSFLWKFRQMGSEARSRSSVFG